MTEERAKRKLTAILSADAKDYSRLMGEDELATVEILKQYRQLMQTLIEKYSGRVVDSPGDNVLAEFGSVVDAVECAVTIQAELKEKNSQLPENRRMEFRIGVNLGDVIDDEGRIYGDGVNVTARVEGLAEGGGICVSGIAFDGVKNKLHLGYEYLGEHTVKNIAEPVRVYKVLSEPEAAGKVTGEARPIRWRWAAIAVVLMLLVGAALIWNFYLQPPPIEPASAEKMAFPLPDEPSIAVLPFVNMSEDPKQEYFSDGITENIITALSKVHNMFVIARNSTFTYKNRAVKIQQVAEDLGVRYVLEGSVQKTGDRVRITAQLVDATTGSHLWAERYDRHLIDIFVLQDEITKRIITSLHVKLTAGEDARLYGQTTDNFEAYLKFLQGNAHLMRLNKDATILARQMFKEAIALDANFIFAYVNLAWTHAFDAIYGWTESRVESVKAAEQFAKKALSFDDSFAGTYGVLGSVQVLKGNLKEAVALREKAIALEPNSANYHALLGTSLLLMGDRTEQAIKELKIANRLDPFPPNWILHYLGEAYRVNGECEKAIAIFKKTIKSEPDYWLSHLSLSACYGLLGREEEARAAAAEVLRIDPNFSIMKVMIPYRDKADKTLTIEVLRKAGLPETPPLPLPDKPSIAVLPFVNMSDDPEQEYFSDGISEEIITALSKTPKLFVIARTSSFKYKGKKVDVRTVGLELGVKYVLEGSVRKASDMVRITAQLVDAKTGNHVWADRYDRELKDIFAVQDEITKKIITAMHVKLTEGERARIWAKSTHNLEAYLKVVEGWGYHNLGRFGEARPFFEDAIAIDPGYVAAYGYLANSHLMDVWFGPSASRSNSIKRGFELAQKCIAMDDKLPICHAVLGQFYLMRRQYEEAITEGQLAIDLSPNDPTSAQWFGMSLRSAGRYEEALEEIKRAIRINPFNDGWPIFHLGSAYLMMQRYEDAIATYMQALKVNPKVWPAYIGLTIAYSSLDRMDEARAAASELLKSDPNFSAEHWGKALPYKNQAVKDLFVSSLLKAGLK